MSFTAADCKRLTGTDQPTYYTTPSDWAKCKNLNLNGPTPCWHPHCDCDSDRNLLVPSISNLRIALWLLGISTVLAFIFAGLTS